MGLLADLKTLYHLTFRRGKGKDHAERMESFYGAQATSYDSFRRKFLKGRQELYEAIPVPEDGVWVEMGGGTGSNLEYVGQRLAQLAKVYIVDLSPSLLKVAQQRINDNNWTNAETVEADATSFQPDGGADVVTFSYSLTMIPDWFAAIENASRILRADGVIGAADFYVSRKHPTEGMKRHRWFTRNFWPVWFSTDNVFPSPDHVPFLHQHFDVEHFSEARGKIPYLPFSRMPYYTFVGRKSSSESVNKQTSE